jgi:hypothetical protein
MSLVKYSTSYHSFSDIAAGQPCSAAYPTIIIERQKWSDIQAQILQAINKVQLRMAPDMSVLATHYIPTVKSSGQVVAENRVTIDHEL